MNDGIRDDLNKKLSELSQFTHELAEDFSIFVRKNKYFADSLNQFKLNQE